MQFSGVSTAAAFTEQVSTYDRTDRWDVATVVLEREVVDFVTGSFTRRSIIPRLQKEILLMTRSTSSTHAPRGSWLVQILLLLMMIVDRRGCRSGGRCPIDEDLEQIVDDRD